MNKLKGKIALVTGASRGIGRSIALHLAQAGVLVVVHYSKRKEEAESVVDKIKKDGGSVFAIRADLSTFNGINKLYSMMDQSLQKYIGDTTFDILVNNAGIGQVLTLEESTFEIYVMFRYLKESTFF
jgi:NAD(P)-dependent dehydrogenase (short-subunit alcohol dehydrogenase family)